MRSALVWDPLFTAYRFRPDHPFNPKRLELTISLIEELGLLSGEGVSLVPPRQATEDELLLAHSREYVDAVKRLSAGGTAQDGRQWGLGTEDTPLFARMHEVTATVVGGTLKAAELVMSGEFDRAFAIAGGLHHAHREMASGFCVYDDLAVAIAWLRQEHGARVLYIDNDAHHGDGVQGIFYSDPEVLTFSIHESGRYLFPGTGFVDELGEGDGFGYSLNLPVEPFTEDESWIELYSTALHEVAAAFRPEIIVLQSGCDAHVLDPLTHLRCTTAMYEETVRLTCEVADEYCGGRLVATGGGGYAVWTVVPRAWALVWARLSGQAVSNGIPHSWLQQWQGESPDLLPRELRDPADAFAPVPRREEIEAMNRRTLAALRKDALPLLRGWSMEF
ncbi:acetoin utilization protein AcuC [soil metagenome]